MPGAVSIYDFRAVRAALAFFEHYTRGLGSELWNDRTAPAAGTSMLRRPLSRSISRQLRSDTDR